MVPARGDIAPRAPPKMSEQRGALPYPWPKTVGRPGRSGGLFVCDECIIFLVMSSAHRVFETPATGGTPLVERRHVDLCHCNGDLCKA